MTYQNRVDPFGRLLAVPQRGFMMGNRGNLHNKGTGILREFKLKAWIACLLEYKGCHREVMSPGKYTELFFLDEATALAAGHRPCAACRRVAYNKFVSCWKVSNVILKGQGNKDAIDNRLHVERYSPIPRYERLSELPAGTMVTKGEKPVPHLWFNQELFAWSFAGYTQSIAAQTDDAVQVLTPESIVKILAEGYAASVHETAF